MTSLSAQVVQLHSREVAIKIVGWVVDDNYVHHVPEVQVDDVLPCAGIPRRDAAVVQEDEGPGHVIHRLRAPNHIPAV